MTPPAGFANPSFFGIFAIAGADSSQQGIEHVAEILVERFGHFLRRTTPGASPRLYVGMVAPMLAQQSSVIVQT